MWLVANFGLIVEVLSYVISAAAAVAAVTPTPKDDSIVAGIRKVVDVLGFNFGFAKNK